MDFLLPKLSATMETAKVGKWLKSAGDKVKMGEAILELETDKATMEVEAPADGTLDEVLAEEGAELPIGAVLARLKTDNDASAAPAKPSGSVPKASEAPKPAQPAAPPAKPAATQKASPPPAQKAPSDTGARILASPLARRLARQHDIDLSGLSGSGPHGRIRKRDVMAKADAQPASAARDQTQDQDAPAVAQPVAARGTAASGAEPLSTMRGQIAASVTQSRQTIPSFVLDRFVETAAIARARAYLGPEAAQSGGVKLTFTDFLLQALADCLSLTPTMLNRYTDEGGVPARVRGGSVDIGLVVAVPDGLVIPVLRDLGGKTLASIAASRQAAVQRARSGRLTQADYAPVAMSLSNIGRSGADRFEAIISPGQTSILAVGREHDKVLPRNGGLGVGSGVNLTLSVDHRLIDGVTGGDFLGSLADRIEQGPWSLQ